MRIVGALDARLYFEQIEHRKSHNLCRFIQPPHDFNDLIGLGLKFCPNVKAPPVTLNVSLQRFTRDMRLREWIRKEENESNVTDNTYLRSQPAEEYDPKIYLRSDWEPPLASPAVETSICNLKSEINKLALRKHIKWKNKDNLTARQRYLLEFFRQHTDLVVVQSDKNLGPIVMERAAYIRRTLDDHLLRTETYRRLGPGELEFKECVIRNGVRWQIIKAHREHTIAEHELTYLKRALQSCHRVPQFYITIKLHKKKLGSRPVTGSGGSLLAALSKWVDFKLQPLVKYCPAYIKDWEDLAQKLKRIGPLPKSARLFTIDATSMYTNIDTDHGLKILEQWLLKLRREIKIGADYPIELVLAITDIIMRNNYFKFGSTEWIQLIGTAMGTPMACIYATLYFAWKEINDILPLFKRNLPFMVVLSTTSLVCGCQGTELRMRTSVPK